MLPAIFGNSFFIVSTLVFVAVLLLLESMYLLWRSQRGPQATKLKGRLRALSATHDRTIETRLLRQRMLSELPPMEKFIQSMPRMRALDRVILQSGLNWTVPKLLLGCLAVAVNVALA